MAATKPGHDFDSPAAKAEEPVPRTPGGSSPEDQTDEHWLSVTMPLDDLLPDANGEIVVLCASGDCRLNIVTEQQIGKSGMAGHHLTEDGYDVDGLAYCAFVDGTTLYYAPGLTLSIARPDRR